MAHEAVAHEAVAHAAIAHGAIAHEANAQKTGLSLQIIPGLELHYRMRRNILYKMNKTKLAVFHDTSYHSPVTILAQG